MVLSVNAETIYPSSSSPPHSSQRSYTMTKRPRESDATEAGSSAVGDSEQVLLKAPQVCPCPLHTDASYLDLTDA